MTAGPRPEPTRERGARATGGPHGALLDLQRRAGNAAVSSVIGRPRPRAGRRAPLPASAGPARAVLGDLAEDVRVHQAGDGGPEVPAGALAATHGTDIAVAAGAPGPDTPGRQPAPGPRVGPRGAADHRRRPRRDRRGRGPGRPGRSGGHGRAPGAPARWRLASSTSRPPSTRPASPTPWRHVGFSDAEQQHAYLGNWCRDMSQAMVPMLNDTIGGAGHDDAGVLGGADEVRPAGHPRAARHVRPGRAHGQPHRPGQPRPAPEPAGQPRQGPSAGPGGAHRHRGRRPRRLRHAPSGRQPRPPSAS